MHARAALVSLLLASPALAAPPATTSDLDRMLATIKAAHPDHAANDKIGPVSDLLKVAEEAGQALETAPTPALQRLMNYVHVARLTAYERTGDPAHACALIEDSDVLLARRDAPDVVVKEANQARGAATAICVPPTTASAPTGAVTSPQEEAHPEPGSPVDVPQKRQRRFVSTGLVFGGAAFATLATGAFAGLAIAMKNELRSHVRDLQASGHRTPMDDVLLDTARDGYKIERNIAISAGVVAAAIWGVGAWLYVVEREAYKPKRVSVAPFGGARGTGLTLIGRF